MYFFVCFLFCFFKEEFTTREMYCKMSISDTRNTQFIVHMHQLKCAVYAIYCVVQATWKV